MLCEKCNYNNATIKYTQNSNGKIYEYNLCESCFNNINASQNFINNFFNMFFDVNIPEYSHNYNKCSCGMTLDKLKNSGKIGCEKCYSVFRKNIEPILNNMQAKNIHSGKVPKNANTYKPNVETIESLRKKLNVAVKNEDYEEAIKLRDKIKEIERGSI